MKYEHIITNHEDKDKVVVLLKKHNRCRNKEYPKVIKEFYVKDYVELEKLSLTNPEEYTNQINKSDNIINELMEIISQGRQKGVLGIFYLDCLFQLEELRNLNKHIYNAFTWNACYVDKDTEKILSIG